MLAPSVQASLTGRVVRVIDGDTVVVLTKSDRTVRVRLADIDAPEKGQPFGQRARQFLASRVAGRVVAVAGDSRDRHNRILGTLWADGRDINAELVCGGLAWAYRVRDVAQNPAYLQCENAAREEKKGLWQAPSPVPPWEWRKPLRPGV
ncbi:thermonuclease family protein [Salmonella enterica subsp. enterica]|nr:thermonuclease family protein [Salmonella enterica subsp. enterica serovar Javiana]EEK7952482.1 thermonuclease family protein [Salmonella enterica subsp. enterica serovar Javiana]EEK7979341.1 thermonuclease family protein [Salmonella enterica subsp. enterica serovar Javiana]EEK8040088.1 thermonuclease family protein [Salmonella enterica subsp. enterica serovar Javiana]EEK8073044.1 thermonuclease family protein [Salmonella enterica subsp. enterica serovar Javiana]